MNLLPYVFCFLVLYSLPVFGQKKGLIDQFKQTKDFIDLHFDGYSQLGKATSQIGHRLTGSEQGKKAEDWIFNYLNQNGLDVSFDQFDFNAWQRNTCELQVVPYKSDNYFPVESVSLANTISADGLWHIVDGGDGLEQDLIPLANKIKGNCLLMNLGLTRKDSGRQNLHRAEKVALAIRFGAKAVVFVHPIEANIRLTGTASLTGEEVACPALCVSGKDGRIIREWMRSEKLMAEMKVKNSRTGGKARNLVATVWAPVPSKEFILVCGHLDSWDLATGAIDNGIGSFTMLDIARAVQSQKDHLRRNVIFLWTMGEELGLLGSKHFVNEKKKAGKLSQIKAVVNLDMAGNPVGFNDFAWPASNSWFTKVNKEISLYVPSYQKIEEHQPDLHSDHQPFMLEGIPVFSSISQLPDSVYRCYHANCDNFNLVRSDDMKNSALVHSLMVMQMATDRKIPFRAMNDEKLVKWLEFHKLKEKLVISKEWKWK